MGKGNYGVIRVSNGVENAFYVAANILHVTDLKKDDVKSERAGYDIYTTDSDPTSYVCDLGNRLEVNEEDRSLNIWYDNPELEQVQSDLEKIRLDRDGYIERCKEYEQQILNLEQEIIELKAKLYDCICK